MMRTKSRRFHRFISHIVLGVFTLTVCSFSPYVLKAVEAVSAPLKIEAEHYTKMSGISTVPTTDNDTGLNVIEIHNNDWMEYTVNFEESGNYKVAFRVASVSSTGKLVLKSDGSTLATLDVPNTNSNTVWTTFESTVNISKGLHTITVSAQKGGWCFNWFEFTKSQGISVLELQPSASYDLSENYFSSVASNVSVKQMTMREFIAQKENVCENYDIVYIGNKNGGYTDIGSKPSKIHLKNPDSFISNDTQIVIKDTDPDSQKKKVTEYYSENDITNLRGGEIVDFINNHQQTFICNGAISNSKTKLYKKFNPFKTNKPTNLTFFDSKPSAQSIINAYNLANKRPSLTLTQYPASGNKSDLGHVLTGNTLDFKYGVKNANQNGAAQVKVDLFLDYNGDSLFSDREKIQTVTQTPGNDYQISIALSDDIIGFYEWKLKVTDLTTQTTNAVRGSFVRSGANPRTIKVLQVCPPGNTLDLSKNMDTAMLERAGQFKIIIESVSIQDFQSRYTSNPNYTLNGKYDMVILGFKDSCDDITEHKALDDLKNFVETKQSLMLTHDTISYYINKTTHDKQGHHIANWFRDYIGMNRYLSDPMPVSGNYSFGITDGALTRANNSEKPDTEKTLNVNKGAITSYPNLLPGDNLTVRPTHFQWFQLDMEDPDLVVWYTLYDTSYSQYSNVDPRNNYYTFSHGTVTFSGTGHSDMGVVGNAQAERQLFVNTIMKASYGANHAPILNLIGLSDNQSLIDTQDYLNFSFNVHDLDVDDETLSASLWVNDTKLCDYNNLANPTTQAVSIPKSSFGTGSSFNVTVKASDASGAQSIKTVRINKGSPVESAGLSYLNAPTGNLVSITPNNPVNIQAKFKLRREVQSVKIPLSALKTAEQENVNFDTNTNISLDNVVLGSVNGIKCTKSGDSIVITSTSGSALPQGEYTIPVSFTIANAKGFKFTVFASGLNVTESSSEKVYNFESLKLFPSIKFEEPVESASLSYQKPVQTLSAFQSISPNKKVYTNVNFKLTHEVQKVKLSLQVLQTNEEDAVDFAANTKFKVTDLSIETREGYTFSINDNVLTIQKSSGTLPAGQFSFPASFKIASSQGKIYTVFADGLVVTESNTDKSYAFESLKLFPSIKFENPFRDVSLQYTNQVMTGTTVKLLEGSTVPLEFNFTLVRPVSSFEMELTSDFTNQNFRYLRTVSPMGSGTLQSEAKSDSVKISAANGSTLMPGTYKVLVTFEAVGESGKQSTINLTQVNVNENNEETVYSEAQYTLRPSLECTGGPQIQ